MTATQEVDIYAFEAANVEELSDMIDANIGQDSIFHSTFGYYAANLAGHCENAIRLAGRAIKYTTPESPGVTAIVPEENDIALAKMVAWRERTLTGSKTVLPRECCG